MTEREQIIKDHPLADYISSRGIQVERRGGTVKCLCPFHEDRSPSLEIHEDKKVWVCRAGCGGGSVIDFVMKMDGYGIKQAMDVLSSTIDDDLPPILLVKKTATKKAEPPVEKREVAVYDYRDATGVVKFQVVRYEPKTFAQRKVNPDGSLSWKMDGVERLPYQLPEILSSESVIVVEGEKDVHTLNEIGLVATCNSGGAKKWLPSYSQYLEGKVITLIPDNDEPGQEHARMVLESLAGRVPNVKWLTLPKEMNGKKIKDVTDLKEACKDLEEFAQELMKCAKCARLISKGIESDIVTMDEMQSRYKAEINTIHTKTLDLRKWIPGLKVRPLVPGDAAAIIAPTSGCKTAAIQNILACEPERTCLFFEIEVSERLMFERSVAIATHVGSDDIERAYQSGSMIDWKKTKKLDNLYFCFKSSVTMEYIDEQIERSSAKIGGIPEIVVIDYLQLVRKGKLSRYESTSDAAEVGKILAKKWNTIVIMVSQIGRLEEGQKITVTSAKDSGSIENSVGLLLAIWKEGKNELCLKVLKNTKGETGQEIDMELCGSNLVIRPYR